MVKRLNTINMKSIISEFVRKYKAFKVVTPTEEFQLEEIQDLFCSMSNEELKELADKLEEIEESVDQSV